ncbi:MAG: hypothetical protein EOP48_14105 [Sphingobacteriales bacterium]|nr:MAG: hypothetical protein EOP48_14105 [Sphingobacteriales bacterium]
MIKKIIRDYLNLPFSDTLEEHAFHIHTAYKGFFKSFGSKNADKVFYVIWLDKGSGFFSNLSAVLCHIDIAIKGGMIPVVDFQNFKTLYNTGKIEDTANAWEYYFEPVSPYSLEEVYQSKNVFFCEGKYPDGYEYSVTNIPGIKQIYDQYIVLKPAIEEQILQYQTSDLLGIHFRGQEFKIAPGHYFPPTEKQMIKYTDKALSEYGINQIFLVTEEKAYLDLFVKRYGKLVLYTNAYRTYNVNAYNQSPRDNHRFLLGKEVLIDALLLARCKGLVCGDSNVSEFAQFTGNHKFVYRIWNGVNSSNRLLARYLYRIKKNITGFKVDFKVITPSEKN